MQIVRRTFLRIFPASRIYTVTFKNCADSFLSSHTPRLRCTDTCLSPRLLFVGNENPHNLYVHARFSKLKSFVDKVEHSFYPSLFAQKIGYVHDALSERVLTLLLSLL